MRPWTLLLCLAACAWNQPLPTTPQPGYRCGVTGVACEDGGCCPEETTCGGGPHSVGVPQGECEYIGSDLDGPPGQRKRAREWYP